MSPRKITAAEVKRRRQEIVAELHAPSVPLPAAFVEWLHNGYQPGLSLRPTLSQLLPLVESSLAESTIRGDESLRKHTTHLAYFWSWALERGLAPDVRATVIRVHVDEYCRVGMAGSSERSRGDRRSRLRKIADEINPESAPGKPVSVPRPSIRPPYPFAVMPEIVWAVQIQPTAERKRKGCLCVGLGAGAGIDSADLKLLALPHVDDRGKDGILINVPGDRKRTVAVLREYEPLVRAGLVGLSRKQLLLGREPGRHNVASRVFDDLALDPALPHLEQSRLRSTWLATLMCRPVPLAVIVAAAGLTSGRTLFDLIPFIDAATDPSLLRDGGQA